MLTLINYCKLPYKLQLDNERSIKCALINALVYSVGISVVSIFITSLKFEYKTSLIISVPIFVISGIAMYIQSRYMRSRELNIRNMKIQEHLNELTAMFPDMDTERKQSIAIAHANRTG